MCHCLKVFHSKTFIECLSFEEDNWQNTSACCSFFASGKSLVVKYLRTWQQHSWNILTFVFQRFLVIIEHSFFQKSYSISLFVKLYNKCSALKGAPPTEVELSTSVMSTYTYIPWRGEEGSKSSSSLWIPTLYNVKYKYSHCICMYICICDVVLLIIHMWLSFPSPLDIRKIQLLFCRSAFPPSISSLLCYNSTQYSIVHSRT